MHNYMGASRPLGTTTHRLCKSSSTYSNGSGGVVGDCGNDGGDDSVVVRVSFSITVCCLVVTDVGSTLAFTHFIDLQFSLADSLERNANSTGQNIKY